MAGHSPAIIFFRECPLSEYPQTCDIVDKSPREKIMTLKSLLLATTVALLPAALSIQAQAQGAPTITGQVSSTEEGKMEGVLVSAKKDGSTITKTVVSNDKGEFSFAAANLEPGKYTITIRAAGYTLVGPKTV